MTELPIQGILLRVLSLIDDVGIPYLIMGGFAVRAIGVPRPSYDVDLTIDASDPPLKRLFDALARDGFMIPDEFHKGFRDSLMGMDKVKVQKFDQDHVWDVELFLVTTAYQRAAFARRQKVRFLGGDRWMITPEDLILHKLLANRRMDLVDAEEILKVQQSLDRLYLQEWAGRLEVRHCLDELLRKGGLA